MAADDLELTEWPVSPTPKPLSDRARAFISAGEARFRTVDCFDFVPSDYEYVWRVLDSLPRGRLIEWGSGFGVACGLAALLGFESRGIELHAGLAEASRQLLAEFELPVSIQTGSYFESRAAADFYFVYCWPGRMAQTEAWFAEMAPPGARLLICHGQSELRVKCRRDEDPRLAFTQT